VGKIFILFENSENICQKRRGVNGKIKYLPNFYLTSKQALSDFIFLKIVKIFAKRVGVLQLWGE
jgi:hypothetical protein